MFNVILGNPPNKEERNMIFGRKNMVEVKKLAQEGASAASSVVAAEIVGDKVTSKFLAEKILGAESIENSATKVVLYRSSQAASDVASGYLMAKLNGMVVEMFGMRGENKKRIEKAAVIGGMASGALKLYKIKDAFGDNAQDAAALLASEKARLPVSTDAYLTSKNLSTRSYLTARNNTKAYLTSRNAQPVNDLTRIS